MMQAADRRFRNEAVGRWLRAAWLALFAALLPHAVQAADAAAAASRDPAAPALVLDTGAHSGPIRRLAVDPAGRLLVTASDDKTAIVWDLASGKRLQTLRIPVGADEAGRLYGVAFAPDGRSVAVAGTTAGVQRIVVFDAVTGNQLRSIDARAPGIRALKWIGASAEHGEFLAAVYVGKAALRLFRPDGSLAFESPLAADSYSVSATPAGSLAVAAFDGQVHLFRLTKDGAADDGSITTSLPDPVSVRHSPDGRLLAVGYFSRAAGGRVLVDVLDLESRKRLRSIEFGEIRFGNLMNVAWSNDGRVLYAAGTAYHESGRFLLEHIDWPSGAIKEQVAATDSILDMAPLPDGSLAFASFDGGWGLADGEHLTRHGQAQAPRVVEARSLRISPDALTVQWRGADGRDWSFAIPARRAGSVDAAATLAARPSGRSGLSVSDWENSRAPRIQGHALALFADESSRAAAVLPDESSVVLATSRALRRYDREGHELWSVNLATEARAVDVSADGRLIVVALADGSIRWRRAADGAELLSLLLLVDGRWVLWSDDGYFDAGPGAEDLIGWLVPRPDGERADYFGVSRFRDHFRRPDILDRVLAEADAGRAVALADEARRTRAQHDEPEVTKTLELALQPLRVTEHLPPVVSFEQAPILSTALPELRLDFKVYLPAGQKLDELMLRVNGRPVAAKVLELSPGAGGEVSGHAVIPLAQAEGSVQLVAAAAGGHSMPARAQFTSSAPVLHPAAPVLPALYALVVGVGKYADHELDLDLAGKDGRDFAATLQRQEGKVYRSAEVRLLVDEAATRAAVLQGLHWLETATGPNDVAVVFVAGHGMIDDADIYHFLPHDLDVDHISQTSVSEADLRGTLANVKGRTLLFVDTCYAGKSVGRFTVSEVARMSNGLASAERGVIVFSASSPRQESLEDPAWGNGAFTRALVQGLSGRADFRHEGVVTHKGLDYYVSHEVTTLTGGRQTPVTTVPTGIPDFPLSAD